MLTYPLAGRAVPSEWGGVPVALGNDVQVGVNAEVHLGAGRSFNSLLGVFCGTGVGGGVVIDREMWVGRGAAGEIGHVCIMAKGGAPCTCGRSGCMEAYAGRAAMEIQARKWKSKGKKTDLFKIMKKDRVRLSSGVWYRAIKQKDKMAIKLMDRAIWALGAGVGSSVNLLDVDAVIIGGGLGIRMGKPFVRDIEKAMMPHLIKSKNPPKVLLSSAILVAPWGLPSWSRNSSRSRPSRPRVRQRPLLVPGKLERPRRTLQQAWARRPRQNGAPPGELRPPSE